MKRIVTFLLIVTLIFSLSISAFAADYNGVELPDASAIIEAHPDHPYVWMSSTSLFLYEVPFYADTDGYIKLTEASHYYYYRLDTNSWKLYLDRQGSANDGQVKLEKVVWVSHDVSYPDGSLFMSGGLYTAPGECDGTSCPANDIQHDNICDDCGNVLTFSLRSTLLDYAKYQAEEFGPLAATHTYYAVVEHPTEPDSYMLYVSQIQMGSTDQGQSVTGGDMYVTKVLTMENGSFANQGFTAIDSWSGKVVYANHTIPFFFRVPLKVTVQGPTGELMEMEAPNLTKEFSTLALCGIGLMASLVSLTLCSTWLKKRLKT